MCGLGDTGPTSMASTWPDIVGHLGSRCQRPGAQIHVLADGPQKWFVCFAARMGCSHLGVWQTVLPIPFNACALTNRVLPTRTRPKPSQNAPEPHYPWPIALPVKWDLIHPQLIHSGHGGHGGHGGSSTGAVAPKS